MVADNPLMTTWIRMLSYCCTASADDGSWVMGIIRSFGSSKAFFGAFKISTPSGVSDDVTVFGSTSCTQKMNYNKLYAYCFFSISGNIFYLFLLTWSESNVNTNAFKIIVAIWSFPFNMHLIFHTLPSVTRDWCFHQWMIYVTNEMTYFIIVIIDRLYTIYVSQLKVANNIRYNSFTELNTANEMLLYLVNL